MTADRPADAPRLALAGALLAALLALLLALLVALAPPARAATSGNEITRYDVAVTLAADGAMAVVMDFDFDFGDDPGHGPYLTLPTSVPYDGEFDRVYEYSAVTATSDDDAAAPADVDLEEENGWL